MRKTKVITALALTVVMLAAMTGIAAGVTSLDPDPVNANPGSTITIDVLLDDVGTYTLLLSDNGGAGAFKYTDASVHDWTYKWSESGGEYLIYTSSGSDIVHLEVVIPNDAAEGSYAYNVIDIYQNPSPPIWLVGGTIGIIDVSIPEFATIAIPVASILGLVLFFNHRKRKRE